LIKKALRLYNTVKYLKVKQIFWRLIGLFPKWITQSSSCPAALTLDNTYICITHSNITLDYKNFTFLNETYNLEEIGWDNNSISKLWRYNLNYFEYLLQDSSKKDNLSKQVELIENWIDSNQFGKGTGWEPYPTSLRIINWIKWSFVNDSLSDKALLSLWNQTRRLAIRPEYHLLGNHLFINAKALLFASAFFQLNSDSLIYKRAISILKAELNEQFLHDGAHFELSPMYHSLAMEDLLDLIGISDKLPDSFPTAQIKKKYHNGMQWLKTMVYDNQELSHFNDCANGIAAKITELENYAAILGLESNNKVNNIFFNHKESGFIVYKDDNCHLIADTGKIGPDYLPGHAHADTLSFELAIKGERVIVNSGTSIYGTTKERIRQRGTSAHSTVQIDNQDSSEIWSGFRVARRARPFNIKVNTNNDFVNFSAAHDGYFRLKFAPIHNREWTFDKKNWYIEDNISGFNNTINSMYYFHPAIKIVKNNIGYSIIKNNTKLANISFVNINNVEILDTTYHDKFGVSIPNKCMIVKANSPCNFGINIELL